MDRGKCTESEATYRFSVLKTILCIYTYHLDETRRDEIAQYTLQDSLTQELSTRVVFSTTKIMSATPQELEKQIRNDDGIQLPALGGPIPIVDEIAKNLKYRGVPLRHYPEETLSKGRKVAISTFLILCNSTLVSTSGWFEDGADSFADDVFRGWDERSLRHWQVVRGV